MADPAPNVGYAEDAGGGEIPFGFSVPNFTEIQYPENYGAGAKFSFGYQAKSLLEEAYGQTAEGYGMLAAIRSGLGGKLLSKEELNAKFPGMSVPFSDSMQEAQAQYLYDMEQERRHTDWIINNGPIEGPVALFGARLAASVITNFSPGNFALNLATGYAVGGALTAARLARPLAPYVSRFAQMPGVAQAAAIGTAENLVQEPLMQALAEENQMERTLGQAALEAVAGGVFGAVVFRGIPDLYSGGKRLVGNAGVERTSPDVRAVKAEVALAQHMADNDISVDKLFESGRIPDGPEAYMQHKLPEFTGLEKRGYSYEPRSDFSGTTLYLATVNGAHDVQSAGRNSVLVSGDMFLGTNVVKLTDNPGVAAGTASSGGGKGRIFEVESKAWKLVDLDEVMGPLNQHDPFLVGLRDATRDAGFAPGKEVKFWNNRWKEGWTRRDLLNVFMDLIRDGELEDSAMDVLNARMKANGIDGYRYAGFGPDKYGNETWGQSNEIVLFDTARSGDLKGDIFATKFYDGPVMDKAEPEMTESIMNFTRDQLKPEAQTHYDADVEARLEAITPGRFEEMDVSELKAAEDALFEFADSMEKQGFFSQEDIDQIKEMKEARAMFEEEARLAKEAAFCIGSGP
jgi:hypothetical protein